MEKHRERRRRWRLQFQQEETVANPPRIRSRTQHSQPSNSDLPEDTSNLIAQPNPLQQSSKSPPVSSASSISGASADPTLHRKTARRRNTTSTESSQISSMLPSQYPGGPSRPASASPPARIVPQRYISEETFQPMTSPTSHAPEPQMSETDFKIPISVVQSFLREKGFDDAASALYDLKPRRKKASTHRVVNEKPMAQPEDISIHGSAGSHFSHGSHGSLEDITSDMAASLGDVESSYFEKTDYVRQWQGLAGHISPKPERARIRDIFQAAIEFYSAIMSAVSKTDKNEEKMSLSRSHQLLREWGASYSVNKSRLDQLGDDAKEMVDTILSFLVEICSILTQRIYPLIGKWKSAQDEATTSVEEQAESLMSLVQEIKKTDDESEMSESSVTSNNSTNDTLQQCANDLYEYVQLLNELHPSIEAFLPLAEEHAVIPEEHESELTAPMMFSNLIRSKYDQAPMALISSLGQLNFERYNRMAEAREKNLADVDEQPATQEELEEKSTIFHDSGLGSSLPSSAARTNNAPSPAAPSVAARPVAPRSIAPSSITASSLAFTVAGKTRYRLPRLPKDAATMLFSCNFCAKKVSFTNERAWQQHLLQDLLPYSCLEPGCTKINEVFATRKLWIRHLEREHGVNAQSPPRLCLLCQNYTGSGRVQICRHYADHLEDIAIAASPLEVADEEESDDDSNKSDVLTGKKRSALGVIEEGIEEEEVGKQPNKYSSLPVNDGIFPSCAICSREVGTERCPCEDERLKIAVSQAERRHMHLPMENSRNFVLEKTRGQILDHFNQVSARLTSRYQADISATSDPKRNAKTRSAYQLDIDQAWRASVLLYPETLDYYYSLCEIELPEEGSRALQASVIDEYLRKGRFAAGRRE